MSKSEIATLDEQIRDYVRLVRLYPNSTDFRRILRDLRTKRDMMVSQIGLKR